MEVWTGFMLPRTQTSDGLLWTLKWTFGFHKKLGISVSLCSVDLVKIIQRRKDKGKVSPMATSEYSSTERQRDNLCSTWMRVVCFTLRPIYFSGVPLYRFIKSSWYLMDRSLSGPQSRTGCKEKFCLNLESNPRHLTYNKSLHIRETDCEGAGRWTEVGRLS
jgi:hypothetical protein